MIYDSKNVRELIFKGASRDLKNKDGFRAIDLLEAADLKVELKNELR
jgi:hypothetical protein